MLCCRDGDDDKVIFFPLYDLRWQLAFRVRLLYCESLVVFVVVNLISSVALLSRRRNLYTFYSTDDLNFNYFQTVWIRHD